MSKLLSRRKKLKRGTTRTKTFLSNITAYSENLSTRDEALLKIIEEKDRIAYPEERVSSTECCTCNFE